MKTPEEHKAEFAAGDARFNKLIPADADEIMVILKGHLLIEEQLRGITRSLMANPAHFDSARLSFSNSLHLARAVTGHFNQGACWEAAERLNAVRNQIAHQAEPLSSPELLKKFFTTCEAEKRWDTAHNFPRNTLKLRTYISYIWVTFDALRAVVQVCVQAVPNPLTLADSLKANGDI